MSEKLRVTVGPASSPTIDFEVWDDDWPDKNALAAYAREKWMTEAAFEQELAVAIERAEWTTETGRFGSGEAVAEEEMIRRAFEEAERE